MQGGSRTCQGLLVCDTISCVRLCAHLMCVCSLKPPLLRLVVSSPRVSLSASDTVVHVAACALLSPRDLDAHTHTHTHTTSEREVMEACIRQLESPSLSSGVRDLLGPLVTLFAASCVERELSWYMGQEIVPPRVS